MAQHFTLKSTDGQSFYVIGDKITFKLTPDDTNGAYFAAEVLSEPGGGPWFLHTHEPQETFHVLEGVFEVYGQDANGEKYAIRAEVGDTVQVPGNTPHGFKNVGDTQGRMLLVYEPAEPMYQFFQEVGIPMSKGQTLSELADSLDMDKTMTILKKYMTFVEMPE